MLPIILLTTASAALANAPCAWAPDLSGGTLDVTFYVTTDSEIGRGRPVEEYVRYQRELVEFAQSETPWPMGFRGAGDPIAPPVGIVTTGDNIFGGPGGEHPLLWLIQRLRFEWLWSRSRLFPPLDVFVDPSIGDIESIPYPVYTGLGNHDWDQGALQRGEATLLRHIRSVMPGCWGVTNFHPPSGNYSWNWGRLHLVQLNEWAGARNAGGLDWLREDLRRVGTEAPLLLFQHYGFDGFSRQPNWWTDAERSAFLDLVCDYNVLGIVSGHTHHAVPADETPVVCPQGKKLPGLRNFIGEDGILFNFDGSNGYFGDPPQGTGTFMVFRVVDDGTAAGSFLDVATVSWRRDGASGVEIRGARNGYDFTQTFPIETEAPGSFRNLGLGGWEHLGGRLAGAPVPLVLGDGRVAVLAAHADRSVQFRRESAPGDLSDWLPFGTRPSIGIAATPLVGGRLLLLSLAPTGAIEATLQQPNGSLSSAQRIGTTADVFRAAPKIATLRDEGVEVHAVRAGGVVYRTRTEGDRWQAWQTLGGPVAGAGVVGDPSLVRASDGRLAALARGTDGFAHVNRQLVEYGAWSGWSRVGTRTISSDVAAVGGGATIHLFARDAATQRTWIASGDIDGTAFSEVVLDGPTLLTLAPAVTLDGNGELRLVVADVKGNLHGNRRRPGETWDGWNRMPLLPVRSRPALLPLADGRVGIYATDAAGRELVRASELASWVTPP
jgi:hypothetical protein